MKEPEPLLALTEAWEILDREAGAIRLVVERVPVFEARGRYLAADVRSRLTLPPFDTSAMDGYAVLEGDRRDAYRVLGTVPAGSPCEFQLEPGAAVKVMTGAPVPPGCGSVVRVEYARETGSVVRFDRWEEGNVRRRGRDVAGGEVVARRGARLHPALLAGLIACGVELADVYRPPRVALVSTGDELVESPDQICPGKILDANGPLLSALAEENGLDVASSLRTGDGEKETRAALGEAFERADLVIASGGVSMGDFDVVPGVLRGLGFRLHFGSVAVKPGKPMTLASGNGKLFFGLPGNPVSTFLMFHLFVLRALRVMCGAPPEPRLLRLPLKEDLPPLKGSRISYVPCLLNKDGSVSPVEYHGSGHLLALEAADGFIVLAPGAEGVSAGLPVDVYPLKQAFD